MKMTLIGNVVENIQQHESASQVRQLNTDFWALSPAFLIQWAWDLSKCISKNFPGDPHLLVWASHSKNHHLPYMMP